MNQTWKVTEAEYQTASRLERDPMTSPRDAEAYYQLCRLFRGQIYNGTQAAYALDLIRVGGANNA